MQRPIDFKYSKSSLINILKNSVYLEYCRNNSVIQEYWRQPEYVVYPINEAMQQPIPITCSNINPGDFFVLGESEQIGIITNKVTVYQGMIPKDKQVQSVHPLNDYLEYEISGDIGGFFYKQPHEKLSSSFFSWVPLPYQLLALDNDDEYEKLDALLFMVASECPLINW